MFAGNLVFSTKRAPLAYANFTKSVARPMGAFIRFAGDVGRFTVSRGTSTRPASMEFPTFRQFFAVPLSEMLSRHHGLRYIGSE
jgi:hypothetical protein